jgi:hypothetical protein
LPDEARPPLPLPDEARPSSLPLPEEARPPLEVLPLLLVFLLEPEELLSSLFR